MVDSVSDYDGIRATQSSMLTQNFDMTRSSNFALASHWNV